MSIKVPICQNIKHKYIYIQRKYTYINMYVFVFIVILSSLIILRSLEAFQGADQA